MDTKLFCTHAYALLSLSLSLPFHTSACLFRSFDRTRLYTAMLFCVVAHTHSQQRAILFLFTSDAAGAAVAVAVFSDMKKMMMICVINKCKSTHAPTITSTTKWLCECRHVRVHARVCVSLEMRVICKEIKTKPATHRQYINSHVNMRKSCNMWKLYHRFDILRFFYVYSLLSFR